MNHLVSNLPVFLAQAVDDTGGGAGGAFALGGCFLVAIILIGLASLGLIIWAIVDLIGNPNVDGTMKIVWALVIFFIPLLGSILYLIIGRNMGSGGPPTAGA